MPTKMVTAAAVALGLLCLAPEGETSSSVALASLGQVTSAKASGVTLAIDQGRGSLTFDLSTTSRASVEVRARVNIAARARVTDMLVAVDGHVMETKLVASTRARESYEAVIRSSSDPALLQYVTSTELGDQLELRITPLRRGQTAHVSILIDPPSTDAVWVPDDQHFVSAERSLYATTEPMHPVELPVVLLGCGGPGHGEGGLDKAIVRRYMTRNLPRVKACYQRELLHDSTLAGGVVLHFAIGSDGKTADISVDGDLQSDAVRSCIAEDLAQWEFPAVPNPRLSGLRINYPLTFVPAGS